MDLAQKITQGWIARADRLEDYWRDYAFLGLDETIRVPSAHQVAAIDPNRPGGSGEPPLPKGRTIRASQISLRMFIQLCAVRSPFLVGGKVGPEHVAQILWRLSPQYGDPAERKTFVASIADLPFKATVRAIQRYLDRMLADKPPSSSKSSGSRPDTSFAASVIHALAQTYSWGDEAILDLPMPRIFQYLRKIRRDADPEFSYFNPLRDRVQKYITDKVLEARRVKASGTHAART